MADNETIADIIAEMRGMGNYQRYSGDHARVLADRLEAAHRRERGNAAKLREALEFCVKGMCGFCRMDAEARGMTTECVNGCEALRKAKAALAAPPRNCDVGDAADWEKRFGEECDKGHICSDCPVRYAKTRMAIELDKGARCEFVWAQMPYVEKEGSAK